jgi:iron complex transport system substrate-binding protein
LIEGDFLFFKVFVNCDLELLMKLCLVLCLIIVSVLVSLPGCQATNETPVPVSIIDDLGRSVQINTAPQRIISLAPSNTEILFALGLEDKIVGVTSYCNYPEAAKSKPQVSGFSQVDVEKVVAQQPDLVLASDIHKADVIPALEKLEIKVLAIKPATLEAVMKDIQLAGNITGKTQTATDLVSSLQKRINAVADKTANLSAAEKPRVFYVTWHDPIYTAGSNTMINDLINKTGGANIASDLSGYATITLETVVQRNPQVIVVMSSMGAKNTSFDYIKSEPRLQATDAIKNQHIYLINSDIFGRTTPRIVDGLEELAKLTHPELFP